MKYFEEGILSSDNSSKFDHLFIQQKFLIKKKFLKDTRNV